MHAKNQISLTHKILYGIMSLAVFLAAFGAGNLPPARAQGTTAKTPTGAVVNISAEKGFFGAAREVTLHVTITNPDESSIRVLRWLIPAEGLTEPLFTVTRDGEPVAYLGMLVKRAAPTEQDYITLAAGESLSRAVNLSDYYDLSVSGNYAIQYDVASVELYAKADNNAGRLASNTLNLFIEGRAARAPEAIPAQMVSGTNTFNGCSASRQTDLINARNAASTYTTEAMAYFSANKQGARYTTWFGVYDLSRYNTVSSHYSSISTAVDTANPMNFDCTCTESYYAYVYPNSPYNIYLCNAFWSAPMTGTDSKAGALIHEITHFNVVIGTDDYVYGQSGAQALAISNPAQAIMNADNHEYFAENNPPLEITPTFTISGNAGAAGATLTYTSSSTMADGSGNYSFGVPSGWSGTVTPSKAGYTFTPPNRTYTNVVSNQSGQNYTATQTGGTTLLQDPSFEAYTPNPYWLEASTNYGTPLCTIADCGTDGGTAGPRTGSVWSWFGGTEFVYEAGSLSQSVVFPNGSATLSFYLWIGAAGAGSDTSDVFTAKINGVTVFSANATQINSYPTYTPVSVDVSAFANGASHTLTFSSVITDQYVNFNLDDVSLSTVATGTFADVPTTHWARDWIVRLYNAGITSGCGGGNYCPESAVTRAQMAIFLERGMRGAAYIPPAATGLIFADVPLSYWAVNWIEKLFWDGITSGCGIFPLIYCPEDPVTRAQMAIFLLRAKHGATYTPPSATGLFWDVPTTYWAANWIEQLSAEGITSGCGGGNYCPDNNVSRAEMAVFLVRTFNLP
jgi:peptidyl-Lys metalloendopeptidase